MDELANIADVVRATGARILAMDPTGGGTVPLPPTLDIADAEVMTSTGPLDPIEASDHGNAVVAFEAARRRGHASATVSLIGTPGVHRLHIFNLEDDHSCFVAVTVPEAELLDADRSTPTSGIRQGSYRLNSTGVFIDVSAEFEQLLGWTNEEIVGRSCLDFVHPDDHENGIYGWIELLERPDEKCRMRQRFLTKGSDWLWCEVTDTNLLSDVDAPHVLGELVDVSRELAAQSALQRRETLLDRLTKALPSGVLHIDDGGTVEVHNSRWGELTGLDPQAGIPALLDVVAERAPLERALAHAGETDADIDIEIEFNERGRGTCRFGHLHVRPLSEGAGMLLTLDDTTSFRTYQDELADLARHDSLTGILNRLGLERAIDGQLASGLSVPPECAVLFLDLDRFKAINDLHGHAAGDQVLCSVAERLTHLSGPSDIVGRLGGDEFLMMLIGDGAANRSLAVAVEIEEAMHEIVEVVPQASGAGVSVGRTLTKDGDDFDTVIRRADEAMYEVKRGRSEARRDLRAAA